MVDNLTVVVEETESQATSVNLTGHDKYEHGEKFRVDRRKLEHMLQENGDDDSCSTAGEFFNQIMDATNTVISWPTKLKIGAKSKKDPHIKIAGSPENVKKAKDMVAVRLESKANRVTLKMDVSHTDHSHIIGRRGQSINKVMEETNCHIHFPDSNRGSGNADKSNQVSITGQPEGVEKARSRIREMLPLVLCFEIPRYDSMFLSFEPTSPAIQKISEQYDVTFISKGRSQVGLIVAVRGSQDRVACIREAIGRLTKELTGSSEIPSVVLLNLDVAPQHHMFLVGDVACNVLKIMGQTATKIEIPDPRLGSRHGMITVTGTIDAVIQARALLVNSLPLLLMFDLKEEEARHLEDTPEKVKQIEAKFFVSITIRRKPKQSSKSVTVKSKENNAQNMYLARLEILGNPMDPQVMQHPPPLTLRYPPGTPWFAANQASPGTSPYSSPLASPTPKSLSPARSDSPVSYARRRTPPSSKCPPGFDLWGRNQRSGSLNNYDYHRRTNSADNNFSKIVREAVSEGGSPNQSRDFDMIPRRNSEPTSYVDLWKTPPNDHNQNKAPGSPVCNSPVTNSAHITPPRTNEIRSTQRFSLLEGIKNPISQKLLDSHGSNPASSFDSVASTSLNIDRCMDSSPQNKFADYEKKKGMSTELLMAKAVVNEPQVRIPTNLWSGLHLSKSVDFEALKKKEPMKTEKDSRNVQPPSMETDVKGVKPELLDRAVRRDPGASLQVSRRINVYKSPFSPEVSRNLEKHPVGFEDVLKLYDVGEFAEKFKSLEINNLDVFLSLTKEDLKEAGFEPLGVRKKIENAIEGIKKGIENVKRQSIVNRSENYRVSNPFNNFSASSGRF